MRKMIIDLVVNIFFELVYSPAANASHNLNFNELSQ
uniref:Ribosomal protein L22 n=1 Tax=Oxytropis falcata TaxID=1479707 RepID=A0A8K1ZS05_9FABA|nr:ribosomal protein L22 [Oxytropis falcata]